MRVLTVSLIFMLAVCSCRSTKRTVNRVKASVDSNGQNFNTSSTLTTTEENGLTPVLTTPGDTSRIDVDGTDTTEKTYDLGDKKVKFKGGKNGRIDLETKPKTYNVPVNRKTTKLENNASASTVDVKKNVDTVIKATEKRGFTVPWWAWILFTAAVICTGAYAYKRHLRNGRL